jgi:hypothetical protein
MKNAKLSHRSYTLQINPSLQNDTSLKVLSEAQEEFLNSVSSDIIRLVLQFNLSRSWRTHFSNLCLQVGYDNVDNQDWLDSLDAFDKCISQAEQKVRIQRRKRLIKALRKDSMQESIDGIYIGPPPSPSSPQPPSPNNVTSSNASLIKPTNTTTTTNTTGAAVLIKRKRSSSIALSSLAQKFQSPPEQIPSSMTAIAPPVTGLHHEQQQQQQQFQVNSYNNEMMVPMASLNVSTYPMTNTTNDNDIDNFSIGDLELSVCGDTYFNIQDNRRAKSTNIFLSGIIKYLEEESLPFQYIDCWVPSSQDQGLGYVSTMLTHAGDACHSSLTTLEQYHLHEFGLYSKNYTFAPGAGLPGRCFTLNSSCWENDIQIAAPEYFKRVSCAKDAGIQTVVGIPIQCPSIGTIVVGMYSFLNVPYSEDIVSKCSVRFQELNSEPKWSLSIDVQDCNDDESHDALSSQSNSEQIPPQSFDTQSHASSGKSTEKSSCSSVNGSINASITSDQAIEIANLLAEHMPLDPKNSDLIRSLRILLLKCPHNVQASELDNLTTVRKSYEGYCKAKRNKSDIVDLLISDWIFLSKGHGHITASPWGSSVMAMTHVNYSSTNSTNEVSHDVSPASTETEALNVSNHSSIHLSGFMLPPPTMRNVKLGDEMPSSSKANQMKVYHHNVISCSSLLDIGNVGMETK